MQIDPDTNHNKKDLTDTAGKGTGTGKAALKLFGAPARKIRMIKSRIAAAAVNVSDQTKAAAAVLVLLASVAVLVYETGAWHMFYGSEEDPKPFTQQISVCRDEAGRIALDVIETGTEQTCTDSEERLVSEMDKATASLREEFMEILDSGQGSTFHPASQAERLLFERVREKRKEVLSKDPLLLLVNKWHYLPEDYTADPVTLPNGQMIGSQCYEPLMEMLEDCAEAGGNPIVCSGYRPHNKQVDLFDAQIDRWLYAGYEQEDSEDLASTAVAIPGTSEHELGLAADIYSSENMSLDESQVNTFTQQWLMENCWKYGFILRYPKNKSDITGIIFEPWHYRYVGKKHARKIQEAGICLEEYLEETDHPEETAKDSEEAESLDGEQEYDQTEPFYGY